MTSDKWGWNTPKPTGDLSVGKILRNAAIAYPDKVIIDATLGISRTFREINQRANSIANGLLAVGCQPGDIITVLFRNNIETLEVYFACARIGLVLMPVSFRLLPKDIETAMRFVGARTIFFDEMFKPIVDKIDIEMKKIIVGEAKEDLIGYDELLKHDSREPEIKVSENDTITLGFTSGTTGTPKCFMRTHYANFNNHINGVVSYDLNYQDIGLTAIPPLTGVTWTVSCMAARASAVVIDFDPVKVLQAIEKYRATNMFLVPAMFKAILDVPNLKDFDLSSLRAVCSVGSFLPIPVLEGIWEYLTPNVYDEYGMQEAGYITVAKPDMKKLKPASAGPPTPMEEARIVDENFNDVPPGTVGEVIVRSADGTGSYWNNEEKTRESYVNGWFLTGDLGRLDEDGHLFIVGRKKDMIISGGYNVYATDVEDVILGHPDVLDCAVVGLPDEKWGEKVTAMVHLKPGTSISEDEMVAYCKEKLTNYKVPKRVLFLDAIPRTLSGKAQKFKLIAEFQDK